MYIIEWILYWEFGTFRDMHGMNVDGLYTESTFRRIHVKFENIFFSRQVTGCAK